MLKPIEEEKPKPLKKITPHHLFEIKLMLEDLRPEEVCYGPVVRDPDIRAGVMDLYLHVLDGTNCRLTR